MELIKSGGIHAGGGCASARQWLFSALVHLQGHSRVLAGVTAQLPSGSVEDRPHSCEGSKDCPPLCSANTENLACALTAQPVIDLRWYRRQLRAIPACRIE